jgi:hypothetical protein
MANPALASSAPSAPPRPPKPRRRSTRPGPRPATRRRATPARRASTGGGPRSSQARSRPRQRSRPRAKRQISARRVVQPAFAGAAAGAAMLPGAAVRSAVAVRDLSDSSLIVRLTRGRGWIGVLSVLLFGIVALNVLSLSLNAGSGRISQAIEQLERQNSGLRAQLAEQLSASRIEGSAAVEGLAVPAPEDISYLSPEDGDLDRLLKLLENETLLSGEPWSSEDASETISYLPAAASGAESATASPSPTPAAAAPTPAAASPAPSSGGGSTGSSGGGSAGTGGVGL